MEAIKGKKFKSTDDLLCEILSNQKTLFQKINSINRVHSFPICVDGKMWIKSIVFDLKGVYIITYWFNELGVKVSPPNSNLINNDNCKNNCNCEELNTNPVIFEDTFEDVLTTVQEYIIN